MSCLEKDFLVKFQFTEKGLLIRGEDTIRSTSTTKAMQDYTRDHPGVFVYYGGPVSSQAKINKTIN
jgi:hypothetical protein